MWVLRSISGFARWARSPSPVSVGVKTSCRAFRRIGATRPQMQPPAQAPCTRREVVILFPVTPCYRFGIRSHSACSQYYPQGTWPVYVDSPVEVKRAASRLFAPWGLRGKFLSLDHGEETTDRYRSLVFEHPLWAGAHSLIPIQDEHPLRAPGGPGGSHRAAGAGSRGRRNPSGSARSHRF